MVPCSQIKKCETMNMLDETSYPPDVKKTLKDEIFRPSGNVVFSVGDRREV